MLNDFSLDKVEKVFEISLNILIYVLNMLIQT